MPAGSPNARRRIRMVAGRGRRLLRSRTLRTSARGGREHLGRAAADVSGNAGRLHAGEHLAGRWL
jgi:hypothetical protein